MQDANRSDDVAPAVVPYGINTFSFAESGAGFFPKLLIHCVEWLSGKITVLRIVRGFEKTGRKFETTIWKKAQDLLKVTIDCPAEDIARIPEKGPLVIVANHPYGFVDGLVLANLVCQVRQDFKILTRAFFASIEEVEWHMLPVAFPHDEDSINKNIALRKSVMEHLSNDGVIILFPAGRVATSSTYFGKASEHVWNPFTAKMILRSNARVLPIYFPGQNSRLYQMVQMFSATLRQSLMLHEIVKSIGSTQKPAIGDVIEREEIDPWKTNPTGFMANLREITLALGK